MKDFHAGGGREQRCLLTPETLRMIRRKGFVPPGPVLGWNNRSEETYLCAGCGAAIFSSRERFAVRTSMPIFWAPFSSECIQPRIDVAGRIIRRQISCSRCGAHLGAVYEDGRPPTGQRYFVSVSALTAQSAVPDRRTAPFRATG